MTLLEKPSVFDQRCVPILETERLVLRTPRPEDARALAGLVGDRRVAENTTRIPHPFSIHDAEQWIHMAGREAGEPSFLICMDGEVIGACGFHTRNSVPEIGYWIGVPFWGNGFATEAVRALIDHVFAERYYPAIHAGTRVSNPASRRVLEKCGFQWTGVGLYRIRAINSSAPLDRFRLERAIWSSLKSWGTVRRSGKFKRAEG